MKNLFLSILLSLIVPIIVLIINDGMYVGLWYYFMVPLVILGANVGFKLPSSFYIGVSGAIAISFIIYLNINWTLKEGLFGLGHFLSLPGAFLTVIITAFLLKKKENYNIDQNLMLGFFSFSLGFFINQIIVCNTWMYCGILSFLL